jgi:hypothetical protein
MVQTSVGHQMGPANSFSSQKSFTLRDPFDNEFGRGILAAKEFAIR